MLRQLPNVLTLLNLLFGTIAVLIFPDVHYSTILFLICGSLVADILDGALARKMGTAGDLGIQLDSLADVVSFGVLPARILYSLHQELPGHEVENLFYIVLTAAVAVSAGLRLARFNVDTRPREYFWGLATPAGGILVAALGWSVYLHHDFDGHIELLEMITALLCVFLIVFYQVALKLPGLKSPKAGKMVAAVIAVLTVLGLFLIGPISIALGIVLYVVAGLLNLALKIY